MNNKRTVTFQFIDGTSMTIVFPEQGGDDSTTKMANIRKAMEAERVPFEAGGKLLLIQMRNVKFVEITPTPEVLPIDIIRDAQVVS